jgi:hypothetical protein
LPRSCTLDVNNQELGTEYRGAELLLYFAILPVGSGKIAKASQPVATLRINGIVRDTASSARDPVTLKVTSTVQTDYEWHEYIEALVEYGPTTIVARLLASSAELASITVNRPH